jgi:hypothetical protein
MTALKTQTFRNHASFDPLYHVFALVAIFANLVLGIVFLVKYVQTQTILAVWVVILSLALLMIFVRLRTYPMKVQDRVIRLEERMRMAVLLPEGLQKRIPELTEDQLIGLRFASDAELPALVELTLEKNLDRKQIKQRIQNWRPDYWRV